MTCPLVDGVDAVGIDELVAVARHGTAVTLSEASISAIRAGRGIIDALADDPEPALRRLDRLRRPGDQADPAESCAPHLQRSLIRSHAAGSGRRGRARGRAGDDAAATLDARHGPHRRARSRPPRRYAALLSAGITPIVHEYGSLGCSGDLAPLAHCALALMGEGDGA